MYSRWKKKLGIGSKLSKSETNMSLDHFCNVSKTTITAIEKNHEGLLLFHYKKALKYAWHVLKV